MVASTKKSSLLGRRRQKAAPPKTQAKAAAAATATATGATEKSELDKSVKEKVVSANNNKKWLKVKTALEETPRASNSTRNWQDKRGDDTTDGDDYSTDESREGDGKSFESVDSSTTGGSLGRVGSSWDDDDQQENAFFEKSVKVETHQAVVKVLEHGNTQMLVLEVSLVLICL